MLNSELAIKHSVTILSAPNLQPLQAFSTIKLLTPQQLLKTFKLTKVVPKLQKILLICQTLLILQKSGNKNMTPNLKTSCLPQIAILFNQYQTKQV